MRKQLFEDESLLDSGLRNANPCPAEQAPDLDERALADLAMILAKAPASTSSLENQANTATSTREAAAPGNVVTLDAKRRATRRWVLGALAAVAAGVLVAVPISSSLNAPGSAIAAPLPLTQIKPATFDTEAAVEKLISAVKANPDPADFKPGYLDMEHWEADSMFIPLDEQYPSADTFDKDADNSVVSIDGTSDSHVSIPVKNEIRREADDSGSIKQIVGNPFSTTGQNVEFVPFDGNATPGTVTTHVFEPGGMSMLMHPQAPARTAKEFYDRVYGGLRPDAAEVYDGPQGYIQTIGFMMTEWKLDQRQTAALLGTIPMISDIKVLGTTTDRWNRDAMVFGLDSRREGDNGGVYRTMLMFDPTTGRLTNYAEEYLPDVNSTDQPDFDFDTVVRYIAVSP